LRAILLLADDFAAAFLGFDFVSFLFIRFAVATTPSQTAMPVVLGDAM
jgi:hypothetical protein